MKTKFHYIMYLLSLFGATLGIFIAKIVINHTEWNSVLEMGIYFGIPIILAVLGGITAQKISPAVITMQYDIFKKCILLAMLISIL